MFHAVSQYHSLGAGAKNGQEWQKKVKFIVFKSEPLVSNLTAASCSDDFSDEIKNFE